MNMAINWLTRLAAVIFTIAVFGQADARNSIEFNELNGARTLTVNLADADITDVARELSKKAGIVVLLDESVSERISQRFEGLSLERGIRRLFRRANTAFIFKSENGPDRRTRLEVVRIFANGGSPASKYRVFDQHDSVPVEKNESVISAGPVAASELSRGHGTPGTPGAIHNEIVRTKLDIENDRKKSNSLDDYNAKMAGIMGRLGRNPSPEERAAIIRSFSPGQNAGEKHAEAVISMQKEKRLRNLVEQESAFTGRLKFEERTRQAQMRREAPQP